jgi:hypothetical protein
MVEPLAIWGAVAGSIGTINTLKTWIQELRTFVRAANEAGETLQNMFDDYLVCQVDLEEWAKMFGINETVSRNYQVKLWGTSGSRAVLAHLESIYRTLEDVKTILRSFLKDTGMLSLPGVPRTQAQSSQLFSQTELAGASRKKVSQTQKDLSLSKTIEFVSSKAPELLRKLAFVQKQITDVKERSKTAFQNKHQIAISGNFLSRENLEAVRTLILVQYAYTSRMASKSLYQSCYAASRRLPVDGTIKDIKLEMDLLPREAVNTASVAAYEALALQYQFLVAWPGKVLELFVKGPFSPEQDPSLYRAGGEGFYGACLKALNNDSEIFNVTSMAEATWFRSIVPPDTQRITRRRAIKNKNN